MLCIAPAGMQTRLPKRVCYFRVSVSRPCANGAVRAPDSRAAQACISITRAARPVKGGRQSACVVLALGVRLLVEPVFSFKLFHPVSDCADVDDDEGVR